MVLFVELLIESLDVLESVLLLLFLFLYLLLDHFGDAPYLFQSLLVFLLLLLFLHLLLNFAPLFL